HGDSWMHPQETGQFARSIALADAAQVSVERDDVAAFGLAVGEVGPSAVGRVDGEGSRAAIVTRRVARDKFAAAHMPVRQPAAQKDRQSRKSGAIDIVEVDSGRAAHADSPRLGLARSSIGRQNVATTESPLILLPPWFSHRRNSSRPSM